MSQLIFKFPFKTQYYEHIMFLIITLMHKLENWQAENGLIFGPNFSCGKHINFEKK